MTRFIRTDSKQYSKLGRKRKKLQKWRRAKGRDNKIREKKRGHPRAPEMGYKSPKKTAGKVQGKETRVVNNIKDLAALKGKGMVAVIGKVGAKKKLELIKKAEDLGIAIMNVGTKQIRGQAHAAQ